MGVGAIDTLDLNRVCLEKSGCGSNATGADPLNRLCLVHAIDHGI